MKNNGGFTLIETLIVFSVFLVMTFSSFLLLKPVHHSLVKNLFFSQFKSDLFFAQQHSIAAQEDVTVHILPEKHYYYIRSRYNGPILLERHYSEEIQIWEGTLKLYFQYGQDGNIKNFGSFHIKIDSHVYRMTILIGKGRFYVVEQ
ncbi:type II secretion system protein [Mesobacillus foraminis]|uniref:competence type IV pilus minor pilin ComGD n=1 Tax=Mesobacillus foraminis TaxID=279826 RepID=UPI001BE95B55|nr:competence type IV pilus minor pilin ComGD [Mesobacillus foraminis]MBT2754751.1 type II secretion system protein [Mesobacillus foraminis]